MAIPIQCPDCRAAFEVADRFAGRIFRCTFCQKEIHLPSSQPAEQSRKPFGWATSPRSKPAPLPPAEEVVEAKLVEPEEPPSPRKLAPLRAASVRERRPESDDRNEDNDEDNDPPRRTSERKRNSVEADPKPSGISYPTVLGLGVALLIFAAVSVFLSWNTKREVSRTAESITLAALFARGPAEDVRVTISEFQAGPVIRTITMAKSGTTTHTYLVFEPVKHPGGNAPRAMIVDFNHGLEPDEINDLLRKQSLTGTFGFSRSVSGGVEEVLKANFPDADPRRTAFLDVKKDDSKRWFIIAALTGFGGAITALIGLYGLFVLGPAKKRR